MADLFGPAGPAGLPVTTQTGIPYEITSVMPGPRSDFVPGANRTIIECRIAAITQPIWNKDMVGTVAYNNNFTPQSGPGVPTALTRTIPELCPLAPTGNFDPNIGGIGGQWCTRTEQIDNGGGGLFQPPGPSLTGPSANPVNGWPVPQWERYRATFENVGYSVLSDAAMAANAGANAPEMLRYVKRSRQSKYSEQQIPLGQLYIAGSGSGPDGARGIIPLPPTAGQFIKVASAIVKYVWVRVPVNCIPYSTLLACENLINLGIWDTVNPFGYQWPDGTLRFAGFNDEHKYTDSTGIWVCDLELNFEYRNIGTDTSTFRFVPQNVQLGWNYHYIPKKISIPGGGFTGNFVGVTTDGGPVNAAAGPICNVLYPAVNFNQLFWPQPA